MEKRVIYVNFNILVDVIWINTLFLCKGKEDCHEDNRLLKPLPEIHSEWMKWQLVHQRSCPDGGPEQLLICNTIQLPKCWKWLTTMKASAAVNGAGQLRAGTGCWLCLAAVQGDCWPPQRLLEAWNWTNSERETHLMHSETHSSCPVGFTPACSEAFSERSDPVASPGVPHVQCSWGSTP